MKCTRGRLFFSGQHALILALNSRCSSALATEQSHDGLFCCGGASGQVHM